MYCTCMVVLISLVMRSTLLLVVNTIYHIYNICISVAIIK